MKTLRYFGLALLAIVLCINLSACSDDGETSSTPNILGTWECIEGAYYMETGKIIKFLNGDFDESKYNKGGTLKGKKCFFSNINNNDTNNLTESQWNKEIIKDGDTFEFPELYTLKGNTLTLMECDYDRWIGTISIENDIMTYTYKYQNWRVIDSDKQIMEEEKGPFTVKFQKR